MRDVRICTIVQFLPQLRRRHTLSVILYSTIISNIACKCYEAIDNNIFTIPATRNFRLTTATLPHILTCLRSPGRLPCEMITMMMVPLKPVTQHPSRDVQHLINCATYSHAVVRRTDEQRPTARCFPISFQNGSSLAMSNLIPCFVP